MKDNRSKAQIMRDDDPTIAEWLRQNGDPVCFYCGEEYRYTKWGNKNSGYWSPNFPECDCLKEANRGEILLLTQRSKILEERFR